MITLATVTSPANLDAKPYSKQFSVTGLPYFGSWRFARLSSLSPCFDTLSENERKRNCRVRDATYTFRLMVLETLTVSRLVNELGLANRIAPHFVF